MPAWAQFLAIFLSAVMLTLGFSNRDFIFSILDDSSNVPVEVVADTIEVEFLIYSKDDNEPIERAEVQFIFDGAPEPRLTNSDGYVKIEIPSRDDVDVVIKKEGFEDLNRTINLSADEDRTVPYFLETDESFSSYNLKGSGFSEGLRIQMSSYRTLEYKTSKGNREESDFQSPFITIESIEEKNAEEVLEVLELDNRQPSKVNTKIGKDKSSVTVEMSFTSKENNKTYDYSGALSKSNIFEGHTISSTKAGSEWQSELIGQSPTAEQLSVLTRPNFYESPFYEYPEQPLKVGQSWSFSDKNLKFGEDDLIITSSDITAKLEEITEYEGETAALLSVGGSLRAVLADSDELANEDSDYQQEESMFDRIFDRIRKEFASDIMQDYFIPDAITEISEDLYYSEVTYLNETMRENSPELYSTLWSIYVDVSSEENFRNYSLASIEDSVRREIEKKSILEVSTARLHKAMFEEGETNDGDQGENAVLNLSISGTVYRSLKSPLDLSREFSFEGNVDQSLTSEFRGTSVEKFSTI